MKVSLSYRVSGGCVAYIESHEGEHAIFETCEGSPADACRMAAADLRAAAARFDALATEAKPYHEATHRRVNRAAVR